MQVEDVQIRLDSVRFFSGKMKKWQPNIKFHTIDSISFAVDGARIQFREDFDVRYDACVHTRALGSSKMYAMARCCTFLFFQSTDLAQHVPFGFPCVSIARSVSLQLHVRAT